MQRLTAKQPMYEHVICPSAVQLLDVYMGAEAVPSEAVMWDLDNPNDSFTSGYQVSATFSPRHSTLWSAWTKQCTLA